MWSSGSDYTLKITASWKTLGTYPSMTLAKAMKEAPTWQEVVNCGTNPIEVERN
jgi:enoyl-[acyl-carrier-protein] reductase (NADH)